MNILRYRHNYWSCSEFADWCYKLVETKKISSGTSEEWVDWETKTKTLYPKTYWFCEEFLDKAQDVMMFPYDVYDTIRIYIRNRFFCKTHIIATGLRKGEYHEVSDTLLYGMFNVLVDFVEIEKAHMELISHSELPRPFWSKFRFLRFFEIRSKQLGLAYLDWEMSLEDGCSHQAISAKEIVELYNWWTITRPNRFCSYEVSGYNQFLEDHPYEGIARKDRDPLVIEEQNRLSDIQSKIEEQYWDEDTKMLTKLIEIRGHLWT